MANNPIYSRGEIDLVAFWQALWRAKFVFLLFSIVGGGIFAAYSLSLPDKFKSEILLAPVERSGSGSMGGTGGRLSGFATLAGLNLGGESIDKTTLALEILKSRNFLLNFIYDEKIGLYVYGGAAWSEDASEWVITLTDEVLISNLNAPKYTNTNLKIDEKLFRVLRNSLSVNRDSTTGLVKIELEALSPVAARDWLEKIVRTLDHNIRSRDRSQAEASISYLQAQLGSTSIAEMQKIFFELIEQQTKQKMLADVEGEYVFNVVDPPVEPYEPVGPSRILITIAGAFSGFILALAFVLVWNIFRNE